MLLYLVTLLNYFTYIRPIYAPEMAAVLTQPFSSVKTRHMMHGTSKSVNMLLTAEI